MDKLEILIDSLSYGGRGVGRHEGIVYFVPYSVPGDLLDVRITGTEKRYREAEIIRILKPSEDRVNPPCPYFGECGGCQWQHVNYEKQIESKHTELISAFTKNRLESTAGLINPITASPKQYSYRRMARFKIEQKNEEKASFGFYRQSSRKLIEIERCLLLDDRINTYLAEIDTGRPGLVGFDLFLDSEDVVKPFYRFSEKDPGADFIQVNPEINDKMSSCIGDIVRKELGPGGVNNGNARILDLYCGDGNLSLQFADISAEITGWDSSRTAIERGRARAEEKEKAHPSCKIKFHEADVGRSWRDIAGHARKSDCVILDPPRRGLKNQAARLAGLGVPLIVYVSCSPPALVRDLKVLTGAGYSVNKIQPFDMFPQTYHLETVTVLKKKS